MRPLPMCGREPAVIDLSTIRSLYRMNVMKLLLPAAHRWLLAACIAWLGIPASLALAGDAAAGAALVGRCVACHGADGIGKAPQYPNLQGQKAA